MEKSTNQIAVLDFGSQYTHLIARRIRELGVKANIYPNDQIMHELKNVAGIVLSGGPTSVISQGSLDYDKKIFDLNIPVLGICHGHQLIAKHFGGKVTSSIKREYGIAEIQSTECPLFEGLPDVHQVWMSHGDNVEVVPTDFVSIAKSKTDQASALMNEKKNIYSIQFHAEVHHTTYGKNILSNFVFNICKSSVNWNTKKILEKIKKDIKEFSKDKKVFLLVSGGVDSSVCYCILENILGKENVYALCIDHGLLRMNESSEVMKDINAAGFKNLNLLNVSNIFLEKLKGIYDPEQKRKIIGELFIETVNKVMNEKKMDSSVWLLGQGTIYPDTIESGQTKNSQVIKTHHNRVQGIQDLIQQGRIIEPIKDLYKDEVRKIGLELGLPKKLINRHPFPGPGLAIRCLCSEGNEMESIKMNDEYTNYYIYKLPIKSVGVQGDERSYQHPALLVSKNNHFSWKALDKLSPKITNTHRDINRVLTLIHGNKDMISKSKLKLADVNIDRLDILRKIDKVVSDIVLNRADCNHIWQLPVVLIPYGYNKQESIILRPVQSLEAMTVSWAKIPNVVLYNIIDRIKSLNLVDYIFFDLTNKPPGTIEWE